MTTPEPIKKFVDAFAELPGIGPRQAIRLAFHFIQSGEANIKETADSIAKLKNIKVCRDCFFITLNQDGLCDTCKAPNRNKKLIAVVEKETDLISIENTKKFNGRYLILGDLKKNGIMDSVQKLRLKTLKAWIKKDLGGQADEIIVAINPTSYGDLNAATITQELKDSAKKISRLGRGIPTGGEIEFADEDTLGEAITKRS